MSGERMVPQNLEAECSVLGSIIIDPDAVVLVADFLSPEDFYRDAHRLIYSAVMQLYNQRIPADSVTISDLLEQQQHLETVGGPAYITSLINYVPTSGNAVYYGRIVSRTALLRRLIQAGGQIVAQAFEDDEADAAMTLERAEQLIFEISERYSSATAASVHVRDLVASYMERLDHVHANRGTVVGVPTGFVDLDRLLGGLQRSDLIILAGRPGMGKSGVALSIAHNAARLHHRKIGIFSLEMSKEQLIQRLLAVDSGVDQQHLRTGWIEDEEWERIISSMGTISDMDIWIDDTSAISTMQMRSKARRWLLEHGIELVIVDYLQLMQSSQADGRKQRNREQEVAEISKSLKGLARELNVPVLALAQLSRAVESRASKVPQLSDLRESGCLTGDTLIYLPESGAYRRIDEMVGQSGFSVLALNPETWKLESKQVTHAFSTGRKTVYKLTTRLGRIIRATANHTFLTIQGWRRLDELRKKNHIALPRQLVSPAIPATMSDEELGLLGHLIGDGCTRARRAIEYTTGERSLAELVSTLARVVFGDKVRPHIKQDKRDTHATPRYYTYLPMSEHQTHRRRNPVSLWLESLGIFNLRSYEKFVPEKVFTQPPKSIACFLRHLWSTDGCIHLSQGVSHYVNIYYATSSPVLALHVQSLLLRLGMNATVARRSQGQRGRDQFHVWVSGKADREKFLTLVGGLGEKKSIHHAAILAYQQDRIANTNRDIIPRQVWRDIAVPAMVVAGITTRQMQSALGNAYCGTGLYKQNLSRERTGRLASIVHSEALLHLSQSDVYWDEVLSIEPDGEEEVYDLTVDGHHNFVANNIIVHNSIEADADVVMFLYRDEVYHPDSERPNTADLIVAKHRNGPVGEVCLVFEKAQTRFRDFTVSAFTTSQEAAQEQDDDDADIEV